MPRARRRVRAPRIVVEPVEAAKLAGLTYVTDGRSGITRRRAGKSFTYVHPDGTRARDAETLLRIRSLAIPPAWKDVWICPTANGHVQAVGRDARVEEDLARTGLPREKILATVVRLLETTLIRIGNEEYARENGSFGLTTMRDHHVDIEGTTIKFEFRAKSGK